MEADCKYIYRNASSILTGECENIQSMNNLHTRIKEVMQENKWDPPDVARICKLNTPHAIYQWLDGTTKNLKHDNLYHFCRAAEIHIEWLISGELPKYRPEKLRRLELAFEKLDGRDQDLLCSTSDHLAKPHPQTSSQ